MKTIQKAAVSSMKSRLLLASTIAITMTVIGSRVLADDASDIESFYPVNAYVSYDNTSGAYPIITSLASQPGVFGGHTYTGWAILAQDSTGSLELFSSASTLTNLPAGPGTPYTASSAPAVGDMLNAAGQYGPFDGIPELAFSTVVSSNNYINKISSGNAVPTAPIFTIPQLQAGTANGTGILTNSAIAGMYLEIQGVTFSGSTGGFMSTFPLESQANTVNESYTITDGGGHSLEAFDWTTSYSVDGAMGGTAVPTGPVNMTGFFDSFNEFVPLTIAPVPEPSTFMLAGMGLIGGLMALRRRRS
jgi:hypothetical protein